MNRFIAGLLTFFLLHLLTATPALRRRLSKWVGEKAWRGVVTAGSLAGVGLIILGWSDASRAPLFAPSAHAIVAAPWVVSVALILMVIGGSNMNGHIRQTLRHPMLVGTILWSATHLLSNGSLRDTLLFGSFLLFAVYALIALLTTGKRAVFVPHWRHDVFGTFAGLLIAGGVMMGHRWLFGLPAVL